jgi:lysophospholipase L1-like esterase
MNAKCLPLASLLCSLLWSAPLRAQAPASNSATADFPQASRYRSANLDLTRAAKEVTVVFLGDSLTDYWGSRSGHWFADPAWFNRGIGGQTTSQLLLREQGDALAFHPRAIVLEGGSNDMRLGFTPEEIRDRFLSMGQLAQVNHVAVFIATMTPVCDCFRPLTGLRTVEHIRQLNDLLAELCKQRHWTLIDINTPLADATGHMRKELTTDGVHPNDDGYALMAPPIERALRRYHAKKF